jgi:alpha-L-fucosidase
LAWGECTRKKDALYFHVLSWPRDGLLRIPGLQGDVGRLTLLTSGQELRYRREGSDLLVTLPQPAPDSPATTLKLQCAGPVSVDPVRCLMPGLANAFEPPTAVFKGKAAMKKRSWMQEFGNWKHQQRIEGWNEPADAAEWPVRVVAPGMYRVSLVYSRPGQSGRQGRIDLGAQTLWFEAQNTGTEPRHEFNQVVGVISVAQSGQQVLRLSPGNAGDEWLSLKEVRLESFDPPANRVDKTTLSQRAAPGAPGKPGVL